MKNRYLQKVITLYGDESKEIFLDIEYRRTEPDYRSIDIKEVKIHRAFINDETKRYVLKVPDDKRKKYDLEEGYLELIRGGLIEIDLDEESEEKFREAFIESVIHSKMCEAIHSLQNLYGNDIKEWVIPPSETL